MKPKCRTPGFLFTCTCFIHCQIKSFEGRASPKMNVKIADNHNHGLSLPRHHASLPGIHCFSSRTSLRLFQDFTVSLPRLHCVSSRNSLRLFQDFTASLPGLHCVSSTTSLRLLQDFTAFLPGLHCVSSRTLLRL